MKKLLLLLPLFLLAGVVSTARSQTMLPGPGNSVITIPNGWTVNQNSTGWGSSSYAPNLGATIAGTAPTWLSNITEVSVVWGGCWK